MADEETTQDDTQEDTAGESVPGNQPTEPATGGVPEVADDAPNSTPKNEGSDVNPPTSDGADDDDDAEEEA